MKSLLRVLFVVGAFAISAGAQSGVLTEFDVPGAATVPSSACGYSCGTVPLANNDWGVVVGGYTDPNVVPHGIYLMKTLMDEVSFEESGRAVHMRKKSNLGADAQRRAA